MKYSIKGFILRFYLIYAFLCLIGNFFIRYNKISILTMLIIIVFILGLYYGSYIGGKLSFRTLSLPLRFSPDSLLKFLTIILTLSITYTCYLYLKTYHSISYMINHAYDIRVANIGETNGIVPIYITYTNSLIYSMFAFSLSLLGRKQSVKYKLFSIYFLILILLNDLTNFGRIGTLYAIFCVVGYYVVYNKKIISLKNLFLIVILFGALSLPRLLRGSFDNFSATISRYSPYFKYHLPSWLNSIVSNYIYYFSSPYALSSFFDQHKIQYTFGFRLLTPVFNLLFRIFNLPRQNTIDPNAYIPFDFNIYSVIHDIYLDYSVLGLAIVPLFIGIYFGRLFSINKPKFNALKIYMFGWLLYTPLYNAFSFGGFFISFVFLSFLNILEEKI